MMRFSSPMIISRLRNPISPSTMTILRSCLARPMPRLAVGVVFPTPPRQNFSSLIDIPHQDHIAVEDLFLTRAQAAAQVERVAALGGRGLGSFVLRRGRQLTLSHRQALFVEQLTARRRGGHRVAQEQPLAMQDVLQRPPLVLVEQTLTKVQHYR